MLKELFYLSSGSSKWGTGHLRRSIELVGVLRKRGLQINTTALVPDHGEMQKLFKYIKDYDRRVSSLGEIGSVDARGIIVDVHTDFQSELLSWLKKQGLLVFGLDWYYDTGKVVNASANLRGGVSGLKYSIIREEFHRAYSNRLGQMPEYDVVIVMGGGDSRGYLTKIHRLFTENSFSSFRKIIMVLGPLVEGKLTEFAGQSIGNITVLRNPNNVADIMAGAKVGITNGGTSLMEFAMLGVPTLIFPQSEQEEDFIAPFLEKGCGVLGLLEPDNFARQVFEICENDFLRKTMSERARTLVDGKGAYRIADIILGTFFSGIRT